MQNSWGGVNNTEPYYHWDYNNSTGQKQQGRGSGNTVTPSQSSRWVLDNSTSAEAQNVTKEVALCVWLDWVSGSSLPRFKSAIYVTNDTYVKYWFEGTNYIYYEPNDGVGTAFVDTKDYNGSITLRGSDAFTRKGYAFMGWNTKADGTGVSYQAGETFSNTHGLKLYAQWKRIVEPLTLTTKVDKWNTTAQLNWDYKDGSNTFLTSKYYCEGRWKIYRKVSDGNWQLQDFEAQYNITTYTDDHLTAGKTYEYAVQFIPDYMTVPQAPDTESLFSKTVTVVMPKSFDFPKFELSKANEAGNTGIRLDWQLEKPGTQVTIQCLNGDTWTDLVKNVNDVSYIDKNVEQFKTYTYRLTVNYWGQDFYSEAKTLYYDDISEVLSVSADRGYYSNMVKVTWTVLHKGVEPTKYIVSKRLIGDANAPYQTIHEVLGTASSYYYEDITAMPGQYYIYKVKAYAYNDQEKEYKPGNEKEVDGFAVSRGIISGRISFGTGTAVPNVTVKMVKNTNEDDNTPQFCSIYNDMAQPAISWTPTENTTGNQLDNRPFSVQFWVRPDETQGDDETTIFAIGYDLAIKLVKSGSSYNVKLMTPSAEGTTTSDTYIQLSASPAVFSHFTLAVTPSATGYDYKLIVKHADEVRTFTVSGTRLSMDNQVWEWGGQTTSAFRGFIDDVRVWTKALDEESAERNRGRILAGTEASLLCYWPMDEGVSDLKYAYDYSKTNGVANNNHALRGHVTNSSTVPSSNQLSLYGETDEQGQYTIRGIPFSGDGTSYKVEPTLGIHKFNPTYTTRYVSNNSLTHNGVDFTDISSFPVRGSVMYANTTIPVVGAYLYVDGNMASKDGDPIQTDENGEFRVDVPIGDHYITVKLDGHVFANGGRYPADDKGVGTLFTFEKEISGLTFFDQTLVTVAGRVSGGEIQNALPLGMAKSKANIGQAKVVLDFNGSDRYFINAKRTGEELTSNYEKSEERRNFSRVTDKVNSEAYVEGNANAVTIMTDPNTGEFAALLPPLKYKASGIIIPSQQDISFADNLPQIDATNVNVIKTDSVLVDEETETYDYFKYVASAKVSYRKPSVMTVTEHQDGSFGEERFRLTDINGNEEDVVLYTFENDVPQYTFKHPVYKQFSRYTYNIYAYEEYINKDDVYEVVDRVPLSGAKVTVKNQYSMEAYVKSDGTFVSVEGESFDLDEDGKAVYSFKAGLPNIQEPYTRGISITYDNNGTALSWDESKPHEAIVLGMLPTGNNFITQGPDKVLMILRDPPGSASSATYGKGHSFTTSTSTTTSSSRDVSYDMTTKFGIKLATWQGIGAGTITEAENEWELESGISIGFSNEDNNTFTNTISVNKEISTSDGSDFVGAVGDVFIGASTNIVFGSSNDVVIRKNEQTGLPELKVVQNMVADQEFETEFNYTANYIENVLIPNMEEVRNSMLTTVANVGNVARPNDGGPIYVTTLTADDEKFGTPNDDEDTWGAEAKTWGNEAARILVETGRWSGPSYTIILPMTYKETFSDQIAWYNNNIALWEKQLYNNEKAKVEAINNRKKYFDRNYSFDAGATVTVSNDTTSTFEYTHASSFSLNIALAENWSAEAMGNGFEFSLSEELGVETSREVGSGKENTTSIAYTLAEEGDDDYLSVDIFKAPDGFGPIFYTRGGATSAPYEDKVETKYYKPGTIIQHKTKQIEKPELQILDQVVTGVPSGKDAVFRVVLHNNSETGEDCYYGLWVNPDSNPNGAQVYLDGENITKGVDILVPAGQPMQKTLTLRQSNPDILEYPDISLSLYSTSQPDDTGIFPGIYSDASVSVYFQPSCSDISLEASAAVVNTETQEPLTLSMSGYDYNQRSFQRIRLQYKGANDAHFVTLQEYVKDPELLKTDENLKLFEPLTGTDKLTLNVDLRTPDFTDQTYVFRAVTVGIYNNKEVTNQSEEIAVVRDMSRPQLISNPTPSTGILGAGDDITVTFNEDIRNNILTKTSNFMVSGVMNEAEVAHDVALNLTGEGTAKTASTINLADKSFSADFWLKYASDGTVLQHGTKGNSFRVAIENSQLTMAVNNVKVASENRLPKDKWLFVTFNYDCSGDVPVVNACYAHDAETVTLISQKALPVYTGNGSLTLGGNGMEAKMQELSLWNGVRTMSDALIDRSRTKNPYTEGLMGYWQMDEGHGSVAADRSRSRNLILPSEHAWFVNTGINYVASLDGSTMIDASNDVATLPDESYLIETWFRARPSEGMATIVSIPAKLDIRLNEKGHLEVNVADAITNAYSKDLKDGQWHHLAFNVLKSTGGVAMLYVDGTPCRQFAASTIPDLNGKLNIGGCVTENGTTHYLKGSIDELRIWKGRFTAGFIRSNMYSRVDDKTEGLAAYYPLEARSIDEYGQGATEPSAMEMMGKTRSLYAASQGVMAEPDYAQDGPSLKSAPARENVQFDFVASERQITIKLLEESGRIENCNIFLTLKDVKDINGNASQPVSWTLYAQQNQLKWVEREIELETLNGEGATFNAEFENQGIVADSWCITGMPEWLDVNTESGTLAPQGTQKLRFTVASGTAIGHYEATVYLTGSQNISAPFHISLNVTGIAPEWSAAPDEEVMAVIGQLTIDGLFSSDENDMVAAFRGMDCVGVAKPVYNSRLDAFIVNMTVYGNGSVNNAALTYKAYDASTGTVYPYVWASDSQADTFAPNKVVGSFNNPVVFTPENRIEQDLSLNRAGWKWMSMYVTTQDDNALASVFDNSGSAVSVVKGLESSASFSDGNGWFGTLDRLDPKTMYKLKANGAFTESIIGTPAATEDMAITLDANGWSWIGYPVNASNTLDHAFADADPQEGDIVMAQSAFAMYSDGGWMGSLTAMIPGEGYKYYSNSQAKTFRYQRPAASARTKAKVAKQGCLLELNYPENMAMVAHVVKDGEILAAHVTVSVFAEDDLRGYSDFSDAEGRHFVTIGGGDNQEQLTIIVRTEDDEYMVPGCITYRPGMIAGDCNHPFVIDLNQAVHVENATTGKSITRIEVFDTNGMIVAIKTNPAAMLTADKLKNMPSGIYIQKVIYSDGKMQIFKTFKQ